MNISTTGYLNNSPHRFNNKNIIPSNLITMDNVNIPLLLRPNKGKSRIAMPNSGEYKFPKADFVTEIPLGRYQPGGSYFDKKGFHYKNIYNTNINTNINTNPLNDCPEGYVKDETGQCVQDNGFNPAQYQNKGMPIVPRLNSNDQMVGGTGATSPFPDNNIFNNENQGMKLKRMFGTPNIPAIIATNLLGFGLSAFANNVEQGRQTAFMQSQMNNPNFNGTYSNAQNDYGVDPYEQTGQLRPQYQAGGRIPITVTNPNDPRLKAYNDSLRLYKMGLENKKKLGAPIKEFLYETNQELDEFKDDTEVDEYKIWKQTGIRPDREYIGDFTNIHGLAKHYEYGYKKPVQPVVYQKPDQITGFSKSITSVPLRKQAPIKKGQPTYEDSMILYNKSIQAEQYLKNEVNPLLKAGRIQEALNKWDRNNLDGTKTQGAYDRLNHPKPTGKYTSDVDSNFYVNKFKKPVGTPQPQEPKFKRTITDTPDYPNMNIGQERPIGTNPNLPQANLDMSKPTKFAFTYQQPGYLKQKSLYFPDLDTLKAFSKQQGFENVQEAADGSSGQVLSHKNIEKYQQGGATYTSYEDINKANEFARNFLMRQNAPNYLANNAVVARKIGDPVVPFVVSGQPPIANRSLVRTLPSDVTVNDVYATSEGKYGYNNPQSGNFVEVDPQSIYSAKKLKIGGYLQKGGRFNPIDYLYGDDDTVDTPNKDVAQKVKQKRITEEDIDNNDVLANDVLNMDSVVGSNRGRYRNTGENSDYVSMYLKHQQGQAGYEAIEKAAQQGLSSVPRSWNKENIQSNMQRNVGKDFKGQLTPQSFINYWANKFNNHMQIAANKQSPYDSVLNKVGQEEGIDPLFLKTVANIESGLNPNNNTGSKYKGLFAMNSKSFKGNIFDPYQNSKAAAQNFKKYEKGGEYELSEEEITDLVNKGYKIEKL